MSYSVDLVPYQSTMYEDSPPSLGPRMPAGIRGKFPVIHGSWFSVIRVQLIKPVTSQLRRRHEVAFQEVGRMYDVSRHSASCSASYSAWWPPSRFPVIPSRHNHLSTIVALCWRPLSRLWRGELLVGRCVRTVAGLTWAVCRRGFIYQAGLCMRFSDGWRCNENAYVRSNKLVSLMDGYRDWGRA